MSDDAAGRGRALLAAGVVLVAPGVAAFAGARATVRVENVARADARALSLGTQTLEGLTHDGGGATAFAFAVWGAPPPPGARAAVRAHVDLDGDGRVSVGDLVSVEHVPASAETRVVVHRVA